MSDLAELGPIIAAVAACLVVTAVLAVFFLKKKRVARRDILILGGINSGKTALFYHLQQQDDTAGQEIATVSSMQPNVAEFVPRQLADGRRKPFRFVDFPGHGSQRVRLPEYLQSVRAIVFMVNSAAPKELPDVALYLFNVLSNARVARARTPVLVACSMAGKPQALSVEEVRKDLGRRIQQLVRDADTMADIGSDGSGASGTVSIGNPDDASFDFESAPSPISFAAVDTKQFNVGPVVQFLSKL